MYICKRKRPTCSRESSFAYAVTCFRKSTGTCGFVRRGAILSCAHTGSGLCSFTARLRAISPCRPLAPLGH